MFLPSSLYAWTPQQFMLLKLDFGSYHWPTAVITKGLHSCLWLTRLGNVITNVCLIGGAQEASCEACVFAQAIPTTLTQQGPGAWDQMYKARKGVSK